MTEETPKPADKIKVGFHQEQDGTYTAFVQFKKLPDEAAAINAAEWIANVLLEVTKPKSTIIQ
jgi:hypothetical protein